MVMHCRPLSSVIVGGSSCIRIEPTPMKRKYSVLTKAGTTAAVAAELASKSVDVHQILDQINVLTIEAAPDQLATIQAIPAVVTIEPDREVRLD